MAEEDRESNIFTFRDKTPVSDPIYDYTDDLKNAHTPIIIDNGAYKCRVGWATDKEPRITFKNVIAKQRGKKDTSIETQIGNDITNIEVVRWQLKSQFDRDIVTHYDVQEQIFDYIFSHLGINTPCGVNHPVVLTEAVCNPNYCRQQMSELLFECYHVPSVTYGIDAMFSLYNNNTSLDNTDALLVSCGYQTVHIMPVLSGKIQTRFTRRVNIGGFQVDSFMQRLLQLKYPAHLNSLTLSRAEELVQAHCGFAVDYMSELNKWVVDDYYMQNVHIFELPHTIAPTPVVDPAQQEDKKKQAAQRLKEVNARRREEKLAQDQEKLQEYLALQEAVEEDGEDDDAIKHALKKLGFASLADLQMAINKLNNGINKLNNRILAEETEAPETPPKPKKIKSELVQKAELLNESDRKELVMRIRHQRQELIDKRAQRKQHKADMAKRRTLASQQRMKIITELASKRKKDDTFGANDDDWNVYKQINKDAGDSDSEAEQEQLEEFESVLREYCEDFKRFEEEMQPSGVKVIDLKEYYRLYVGVERIRTPELLFQPSMIGVEQAGIAETIQFVLNKYPPDIQNKLAQYIYLTGGCATFSNFKAKLERELLAMRPFQSTFAVYTAKNPVLDAWYGARKWALSPEFHSYSVTKAEYEEKGGEYVKNSCISNQYFPTPITTSKTDTSLHKSASQPEFSTKSGISSFEENNSSN